MVNPLRSNATFRANHTLILGMLLVTGYFYNSTILNMRKDTAMMGTLPAKRRDSSLIDNGSGYHS
jgi:hypothetical protein